MRAVFNRLIIIVALAGGMILLLGGYGPGDLFERVPRAWKGGGDAEVFALGVIIGALGMITLGSPLLALPQRLLIWLKTNQRLHFAVLGCLSLAILLFY